MRWALIPIGAVTLAGLLIGAAPASAPSKPADGDVELIPDLGAPPTPPPAPKDVPPAGAPRASSKPKLAPSHPRFPGPGGEKATQRCDLCHTVEGWTTHVRFAHDRTGFALTGPHAEAECVECHAERYAGTPTTCAACHQDVHRGQRGQRCEGCHEVEGGWRAPTFDADAHRYTNFPLIGAHAVMPCEECHVDRRDRTFGHSTVDCFTCHAGEFAQAKAGRGVINHASFPTNCRECHSFWSWKPATMPQHDTCFLISGGPHKGIACANCHNLPVPSQVAGCGTGTVTCTSCHAHQCSKTDRQLPNVPGYLPNQTCNQPEKCYGCHRFTPHGG